MLVLVHISDAGVNESGCTVEGATARVTCWLARIGICKRFGALDVDVGLAPESMPKRGSLPVGYKIGPICRRRLNTDPRSPVEN